MAALFDISMTGDKALGEMFGKLPEKMQKKVARKAMKNAAEQIRTRLLINLSGRVLQEQTGELVSAFETAKVTTRLNKDGVVSGVKLPERSKLGISAGEKWYYPMALEYGGVRNGKRFSAHPFMRPAIDEQRDRLLRQIGKDIRVGITREAIKLGKPRR